MRELPIIYNTEMVRATMKGLKTETRRMKGLERINEQPDDFNDQMFFADESGYKSVNGIIIKPQYLPGDLMYVRETISKKDARIIYRADVCSKYDLPDGFKWTPSIHMPKTAARIWLRCTDVRVERLGDISEAGAIAEGVERLITMPIWYKNYDPKRFTKEELSEAVPECDTAIGSFNTLWKSIVGDKYILNPWVFVYEFEVISTTGAPVKD